MNSAEAKALTIIHFHLPRGDAGASWCDGCKKHINKRADHILEMLKQEGLEITKRVD